MQLYNSKIEIIKNELDNILDCNCFPWYHSKQGWIITTPWTELKINKDFNDTINFIKRNQVWLKKTVQNSNIYKGEIMDIKKMNLDEFQNEGYLQEVNRQFFHPLGLALEVITNLDGTKSLGGIWDYRENEKGLYYDIKHRTIEKKKEMKEKANRVKNQKLKITQNRKSELGYIVEPIDIQNKKI